MTIAGASMRSRRRCRYGFAFCGARRGDAAGAFMEKTPYASSGSAETRFNARSTP
jgi:hypothetical protein